MRKCFVSFSICPWKCFWCEVQRQRGVTLDVPWDPQNADVAAGAARCEPRCADFGVGAALCALIRVLPHMCSHICALMRVLLSAEICVFTLH